MAASMTSIHLSADVVEKLKISFQRLQSIGCALGSFKLKACDGGVGYGIPFSLASCYIELPQQNSLHGFTDLFREGTRMLEEFIFHRESNEDKLLSILLKYIDDIKSAEKRLAPVVDDKEENENEWSTRLAVHYLSKLAYRTAYELNASWKVKPTHCPCSCRSKLNYRDTSMGSPKTWYGLVDILISNNKIPCSDVEKNTRNLKPEELPENTADTSKSSENGITQTEKKTTGLQDSRSQLLAQCITNSFLQRNFTPGVTLVPSIGISKSSIQFYFYDCENDVLLLSPELPLYEDKEGGDYSLKLFTVIATWLVLNYSDLMSGITDKMKSEQKFGFHAIGSCLQHYQKDLKYGHVTPIRPSQFRPWFDSHRTFSCMPSDVKRARIG